MNFSYSLYDEKRSEAHPATVAFLGGKTRPGCDADHSLLSSAEVKKEGAIFPLLLGAFIA
jgi:hypothetical protein